MNTELYNHIFTKMDELGAIRYAFDEFSCDACGLEYRDKLAQPPVLSDVLDVLDQEYGIWTYTRNSDVPLAQEVVDRYMLHKPFLIDQSDELGEMFYSLIM